MIQSSRFSKADSTHIPKIVFWVCCASLVPFIIFFFYTAPVSDDIFYHQYAQNKTTWEFMIDHYSTWTGRYFSNLMMATNPFSLTSDTGFYPPMILSISLFFFFSLFFLCYVLTKSFKLNTEDSSHSRIALSLTMVILALFLHKMPRVTDTFYWFAGTSSHLLPLCFILISAGLYIRGLRLPKGKMRPLSVVFVSLTSVIVCGSNETLAIQWLFILGFVVFYHKLVSDRWEKVLFVPLFVALVGFAFLYFAPGNSVRAKNLTDGHSILKMLYKPAGLTLETFARYLSFSFLLFILISFPTLKSINASLDESLKVKRNRNLFYLFGLGLFGLTFVPSVWVMGSLPPHRVLNNTYLMFLIYSLFLILISAHKLRFMDRLSSHFSRKKGTILFSISTLFLFNNFYAWKDLIHLAKYTNSLKSRELLVASGQGKDVVIPPLAYFPTTFFYEDIKTNPSDYRNIIFAEFHKLKSVALSKDYEDID